MSFRRNRTFVAAWLTPLLVALLALALPATGEAAGTGSISGTVTAEGGGVLAGVEVCAEEVNEEDFGCAFTAANGTYTVSGLEEGEYKVLFWPPEHTNYLYQWYQGMRTWKTATAIMVEEGLTKSGINAVLEKGASISGVVTAAATGAAAPNVLVCAVAIDESSFGCTETNFAGAYTIVGLGSGQFVVEFYPEGNGQGLVYQTYSLGLVTVASHAEVKNVNQALQAGGKIQGVVRLAATGAPLAGVRVCVTLANSVEQFACLTSPTSGAYQFYGLPSGSYKVAFSATAAEIPDEEAKVDAYPTVWWNGATSFATASPIAITPPAIVSGIDGALGPPPVVQVVTPTVLPTTPIQKKVAPKPIRCRKGFAKRKIHGKVRCVRTHKVIRHKHRHKKSA